jgi:succinoglycan biosynthesis transport protein ExoP
LWCGTAFVSILVGFHDAGDGRIGRAHGGSGGGALLSSISQAGSLGGGRMPTTGTTYTSYTARDLVRSCFYYKWPMLLAFLVPFGLGIAAALTRDPAYTAEARLLVLPGQEYTYKPELGQAPSDISMDRTQIVQSEIAIMRDAALQTKVLQEVGPEAVLGRAAAAQPDALARGVATLTSDLNIAAVPLSNAINLTYRNRDPDVAAAVLNKLVALYLDQRRSVFDRSGGSALPDQRGQFATRLRAADDALVQFGQQHQITNLDDQITLLLRQQSDMAQQLSGLDQRVDSDAAQAVQLRAQLAKVPQSIEQFSEVSRSVGGDARSSDLARLEALHREMSRRYQDQSPQLADIDRQIAVARQQIASTPSHDFSASRQARNPLWDDLTATLTKVEADQHGADASRNSLHSTLASVQSRLDELNQAGQQYRTLRRDRDVLEDTYKSISRSAEEDKVNSQAEHDRFANVRLVQAATPPAIGTNTRRLFIVGGFALGVIAAIAVLTVLSALRQVVIDRADAERALGLPVLLTVNLGRPRPMARDNGGGPNQGWAET